MTLLEQFKTQTRPGASGWMPYLVSASFVFVAMLGRMALGPWIEGRSPFALFTPAVILSAGLYGVGPAFFALLLSLALACWMIVAPDGFSPGELISTALFLATSQFMLIFANHLRMARQRSLALEAELQDAHAVAAMGTMAGTLAHELNQPLTAASNYVAACEQLVLLAEGRVGTELSQGLGQAEEQIQRAGSIIREARDMLRNLPLKRSRTGVRDLFFRVVDVAQATSEESGTLFTVDIAKDARSVFVNQVQIEQVLLNIIRNANQAMARQANPTIHLEAKAAENGTLLAIHDNGPGIPRERLANLFSASRVGTDTGLGIGLSLSRTIVEAHGGSIVAQNAPDGGASFFIYLPGEEAESA